MSKITFGGNPTPRDGWAIIIVGAPAVGKTWAIRDKFFMQGKDLSVDHFIEKIPKLLKKSDGGQYDISNMKDYDFIKKIVQEKSFVDKSYSMFKNNRGHSLPNIIKEFCVKDNKDLENEISRIKSIKSADGGGYKIAIIYVVANRGVSYASMFFRKRRVRDDAFHCLHNRYEMKTVENSIIKLSDSINEVYVVFNSTFYYKDGARFDRRLNNEERKNNTVRVTKNNNGVFSFPDKYCVMGLKTTIQEISGIKICPKFYRQNLSVENGYKIDFNHYPTMGYIENRINNGKQRLIDYVDIFVK